MPDITKCLNALCPMAKKCYRFTCELSYRQSVARFTPESKTECKMFIKDERLHKSKPKEKQLFH